MEEKLRVKAEVGARAAARNVEENIVAVVFGGAELAGCVLFGGRIDGCGVDVVVMRGGWGCWGATRFGPSWAWTLRDAHTCVSAVQLHIIFLSSAIGHHRLIGETLLVYSLFYYRVYAFVIQTPLVDSPCSSKSLIQWASSRFDYRLAFFFSLPSSSLS